MPKTKKERKSRVNSNALITPEHSDPLLQDENMELSEGPVEAAPILNKLTSVNKDDRAWAAAAISNLVQQKATRQILLKNNLVGSLIAALAVNEVEVQTEILGALRNIVSCEGDSVCMEMYRKSILSPLNQIAIQMKQFIVALFEDRAENTVQWFLLAEQFLSFLVVLCESCDVIFKVIEESDLLPQAIQIVCRTDVIPIDVALTAAQLAACLTEDSKPARRFFNQNQSMFDQLMTVANGKKSLAADSKAALLRVVAASVMENVRIVLKPHPRIKTVKGNPELLAQVNESIKAAVLCATTMGSDTSNEVNKLVESERTKLQAQEVDQGTGDQSHEEAPNKSMESLAAKLNAVQVALELLANLYADGDAVAEDSEESVSKPHEPEMDDEEMIDIDNDIEFEDEEEEHDSSEASNLISMLTSYANIKLPSPVPHTLKNTVSILYDIRSCSIGALSNIIDKLSRSWIETNFNLVLQLWDWLYNSAMQEESRLVTFTDGSRIQEGYVSEVTESFLSGLCILARKVDSLNDETKKIVHSLTNNESFRADQIEAFASSLGNTGVSVSLRCKCANILSVAAKSTAEVETNKKIGLEFMRIISEITCPVDIVAEVLDGMFDVYGDEDFFYDFPVFYSCGFLQQLKTLYQNIKIKVKSVDKRQFRDSRIRADAALANLRAFIDYKEREYRKRNYRI